MHHHALIEPTASYVAHGASGAPIWSLIKVTASSIIEVVILSFVGYVLARRGIIDKKTQTKINKLNVSFFTPALLFSKVAFTLNPARLAELIIVPLGWVIVTAVSTFSALLLSWIAGLSPAHRNFAVACAISPNSNSLPVALMQSLVITVPQLHWDEEGEPEDTVDGMLGRALTYLVLFSTLGMFLRWSIGAKLLSTVESSGDAAAAEEERRRSDPNAYRDEPQRADGQLVDYGQDDQAGPTAESARTTPHITLRRPTGEVRPQRKRTGPPAWARSFPNSPSQMASEGDQEVEDIDCDDETIAAEGPITLNNGRSQRSCWTRFRTGTGRAFRRFVVHPFKVIGSFMTAPLYAAIISLVVALIGPLQKFIDSLEPVVGALETAGACSIPLTMVVLGAYFHADASAVAESKGSVSTSAPPVAPAGDGPADAQGPEPDKDGFAPHRPSDSNGSSSRTVSQLIDDSSDDFSHDPWRRGSVDGSSSSADSTLVQKDPARRKGISSWITKNPWNSGSSSASSSGAGDLENGRMVDEPRSMSSNEPEAPSYADVASRNADLNARNGAGRRAGAASKKESKEKQQAKMENRTVAVSIASRMILTPLILLPIAAWYAIATRYNVMDDPVFITCACLIIGSPPALTLAQITSQSANGNSGFERLISRTIFVSYAVLAAPTTIALVLTALLIAENDH
ncbi:uncharacterized protein PFL1_02903 [Pseudozyma flocculosa PF-1]|uniref:Endoplasmic reticulum auxin efflux carrier n=2 Tax=Pseudozyma flocculosa TaxID=84751 RepID=A0A5C3F162_9BASI|nr:uncharacterized protein PFL1_02903 [Pseudozyma flocculosa PF-1]EPQ29683.1 hypothetical protein PFL1_02903 [Pseudozyma flocculosa PF-1]SPO38254.1 uncharacterized protein PSFLO_03731 [Pseudozyma flocculosa]